MRAINIASLCAPGKTLLLLGPRRSGKTTLLEHFLQTSAKTVVKYDGTNLSTQMNFSVNEFSRLAPLFEGFDVLAIDEAQNIKNVGTSLKLINDHSPSTIVIATGSSALDLRGQVGEPLVGRKRTCTLYPFAIWELLLNQTNQPPVLAWEQSYHSWLRFGLYPDSVLAKTDIEREIFLREMVDSFLLRDILMYQEVKGAGLLLQLLTLLAHQVGQEVSLTELGASLGIRKETVARYLDLFEKCFILFRLGGFSRNLRSEVTRKAKYYFYDLGVRNAIIGNFNSLEKRNDIGALWENFTIVERMKARAYHPLIANQYFWRTWKQNEIDLVEERGGALFAYEMKFNPRKSASAPLEWQQAYGDNASYQCITPANILEFIRY